MYPNLNARLWLFIAFSFSFLSANAQYAKVTWQKQYPGLQPTFRPLDLCKGGNGGFVVTGLGFQNNDVFKFNDTGGVVWSLNLGANKAITRVMQTKDNYYAGTGMLNADSTYLIKFGQSGVIWTSFITGHSNIPFSNAITSDSGYVISGFTSDSTMPGFHAGFDAFISRLDKNGNILWKRAYGGSGGDALNSVLQTNDGGFIAVGRSPSVDGDLLGVPLTATEDVWILKTDALGNIQWQKRYGAGTTCIGQKVLQAAGGNFMILASVVAWQPNQYVSAPHGNTDIWVLEINTSGNIIWERAYGSTNNESPYEMIAATNGSYTISGDFTGWAINGDILCGTNQTPGAQRAWVFNIDSSGNMKWNKQFLGNSNVGIWETPDSGFITCGYFAHIYPDTNYHLIMTRLDTTSLFSCDSILAVAPKNIKDENVLVYPTITNGIVHVELPTPSESYNIRLTDFTGRLLNTTQTKHGQKIEIDMGGLASGVYLLSVTNGTDRQTFKIIYQP